jgi:hypothetical protein
MKHGRWPVSARIDRLWNRLIAKWWGHWLIAGFFLAGGLLVYLLFTIYERQGGVESRGIVSLLYNLGGKNGALILFGIPTTIFALTGLYKRIKATRESEADDA